MYYQNGNYMQDLNYYNQNPSVGYNPYMPNQYSNQNMAMNQQVPMPQANLNALYPAVYRIISPVVSQVLASNPSGYLTEEGLNNMVDTVYNIVEGDINLGNQNTNSSNENSNASNCERSSSTSRQNTATTTTSAANAQNTLLRDLIKIMILNEMMNRRQNMVNPMMQNNMPNTNMTQPMFL